MAIETEQRLELNSTSALRTMKELIFFMHTYVSKESMCLMKSILMSSKISMSMSIIRIIPSIVFMEFSQNSLDNSIYPMVRCQASKVLPLYFTYAQLHRN